MSKCESCIHYDACKKISDVHGLAFGSSPFCDHFKSKSLFVELPCAVGTPLYVIEYCHCYNSYEEQCRQRRTKASKWLYVTKLPSRHHTRCVKLFERGFKLEYLNRIGKTVFLTEEEARAKLKEMG